MGFSGLSDLDPQETREWLDSIEAVLEREGPERVKFLLGILQQRAQLPGTGIPFSANTPYYNTIPVEDEPEYPGDRQMERRIRNLVRWNAMAMVVRGNRTEPGIGGHISTYQSAAVLYEVAFNHFFRAPSEKSSGDIVYYQGHASPGIYARAFLEGRLSEEKLKNFRRELQKGGGLSSYPHPWLMPDFWQFPSVSMGLAPLMSIYQARFNKHLINRGLLEDHGEKVWGFVGDGETDEPETLAGISLAVRENLDNLIWVVNCNLQRLDGPVRGNGKIIQELERVFRGAGWNVIKVIWADKWDALLAADETGLLAQRMEEVVDGEYQKFAVESGAYIREHFFGKYPELLALLDRLGLTDDDLKALSRGGHDHKKVYAAYKRAMEHTGSPTVILAKTIKGYGLGEAGESRNVAHNTKELKGDAMTRFRDRFALPISDATVAEAGFYHPGEKSEEIKYMLARRKELGGSVPQRRNKAKAFKAPKLEQWAEFFEGTSNPVSTTMAWVRMIGQMLRWEDIGKYIVPIVPDEARTFGMEGLFRQVGIYAAHGQLYTPVDSDSLMYYKEAKNGQILEEGINEAGSLASFIAAGTAYSTHNLPLIPMYVYYSMFGFQRVGDLIWAAADSRTKGFLFGGTSGRTTLNGEGLQHEDGHSHLIASTVPTCRAYDPAFAFELAVITQDGIRRMYEEQEDCFYYVTVMNENYLQPAMPKGVEEGIRRGIYLFKPGVAKKGAPRVRLLGSGTIMQQVLRAQELLAEQFGVSADVYSATSYTELRNDGMSCERHNRLHPGAKARVPYITQVLGKEDTPVVAASDYMRALPDLVAAWVPGGIISLGTDGFGRSESRAALRRHFEVDAEHIAFAALSGLAQRGQFDAKKLKDALKSLGLDADYPDPWTL
ncbi:pyruvate dehydrogenase (acetyl-transferring), homodimeric type [bacterium]|nr:pyruvate dehydrogenase (acetyl-transferring), homodimeric type [bacterium]